LKPNRFEYFDPESVVEAANLLHEYGDDAKVLAGGQSLVPMMNLRLARPAVLVDICRIANLSEITSVDDCLFVGSTARQLAVRRSPVVSMFAPLIEQALRFVGHVATQSRGTFGGIAAHADPTAEIPAVLVALDAGIKAEGPTGERIIPAAQFFLSYFTTALRNDEILTEISIPKMGRHARTTFVEHAPRFGDFALVGLAVVIEAGPDEVIRSARLVLCGVGATPTRMVDAEQILVGNKLGDAGAQRAAASHVHSHLNPLPDRKASTLDRKDIAAALVRRALGGLVAPRRN
jgi:aerobic carbon-monoxide dehydrogenase medium subunit